MRLVVDDFYFFFVTYKAHLFLQFFGLWVSHRIVEAVYANPETSRNRM